MQVNRNAGGGGIWRNGPGQHADAASIVGYIACGIIGLYGDCILRICAKTIEDSGGVRYAFSMPSVGPAPGDNIAADAYIIGGGVP